MNDCQHENFRSEVDVNLLLDAGAFIADVRIRCSECDLPFEFIGVSAGLKGDKPMCSVSAHEIHLPIRPMGSKILPAIPGFEVHPIAIQSRRRQRTNAIAGDSSPRRGVRWIGYRNRSSFDMALLKGAILEIEQPSREICGKLGHFGGVIYPSRPWPDPPARMTVDRIGYIGTDGKPHVLRPGKDFTVDSLTRLFQ